MTLLTTKYQAKRPNRPDYLYQFLLRKMQDKLSAAIESGKLDPKAVQVYSQQIIAKRRIQ